MTWEVTIFADKLFHSVMVLLSEEGTVKDAVEEALEHVNTNHVGLVAIVARPAQEETADE